MLAQISAPQEEAGSCGSLPIIPYCVGSGVYGKTVSQPFLPVSMSVFSHLPSVQESLN